VVVRPVSTAPALCLAALTLVLLALFALTQPAGAASGDLAWQRVYDSPGGANDGYWSTSPAPRGGIYVAGTTNAGHADVLVARYSATGQRLWLRTYNGARSLNDSPEDAATDRRGDLILVGRANDTAMAVLKYAPNGQRRWVRIYNDPGGSSEVASKVAVDRLGAIYVAGLRTTPANVDEIVLLKYSPTGERRWVRRFSAGAMHADPADIALDGKGNVYVTGVRQTSTGNDILTLKYDSTGHRRWMRTWDGPGGGEDYANAMAVTATGTAYVAGRSVGVSSDADAVVLKYSPAGALRWSRTQTSAGASHDEYGGVTLLGGGDVAAAGTINGGAGHGPDALLVRLSPAGATRWVRAYNGPAGNTDRGRSVARGSSDSLFVLGSSYDPATTYDILTLKYSAAGDLMWDRRYAGDGGDGQQNPSALTFNAGVFVAGSQNGLSTDAVLLKYRP
jgi:uncharacterized delta-60 repeat protein